jgi:arylformamidase
MEGRSRAWLDEQYDNRKRVPDFQTHLDAWARDSGDLRRRGPAMLDVAYGETKRQAIDLFRPDGSTPAPLMAFIHGGYWQALDRKDFSFVARPFLASGVACAIIGYDLAPSVSVGEIVEQVRAALVFLHRERVSLGVEASRILVAGHSAGGHLAAMALATDWTERGAPRDLIRGVVALSGLFDLEPIRQCYLNEVLGLEPAEARAQSPNHIPVESEVPVLVVVGGAESEEFLDQSARYVSHLKNYVRSVEHRVEAGLDHFQIVGRFGMSDEPVVQRALAMLGR